MTDSMRIRLAALVVAVVVGGLSLAGLAIRDHGAVAGEAGKVEAQTQSSTQAPPAVPTFGDDEVELDED
jgi:hypothetical protein